MTLLAPPPPRSRQHRRSPWVALVLVLALVITLAGIFPFRQIIAQHRQVDLTEAKLAALDEENERLANHVDLLQTDAEIERQAREQFGLVRKGEVAYTISSPQRPVASSPASGPVVVDSAAERSVLGRLWDFLTGRDLAPDG